MDGAEIYEVDAVFLWFLFGSFYEDITGLDVSMDDGRRLFLGLG